MKTYAVNNMQQTFGAKPKVNVKSFVKYNEELRPLSDYVTEHILPELKGVHKVAKQYNLPVTIADLGKEAPIATRLLVNVGSETRVFDPNKIPTNKMSEEIEKFIREVSGKNEACKSLYEKLFSKVFK